jgi:hypothetical protein
MHEFAACLHVWLAKGIFCFESIRAITAIDKIGSCLGFVALRHLTTEFPTQETVS